MNRFLVFCLVSLFCVLGAVEDEKIRAAMVKIYTVANSPDWYQPWSSARTQQFSGSGCIIGPGRILTNAHVVSYATFLQVRLAGQAARVPAKVKYVAHDADLAILEVAADFGAGITPLEIGELPKSQDEIVVYGFPVGGDTLCTTKGVISRIEHRKYSHSGVELLAEQVDAPINPGNSGGPAIHKGKIAGVDMMGIGSSQSIGYLVPPPVIQHVLQDFASGTYKGFPTLDFDWVDSESPAIKAKYGQSGRGGLLVTHIHPKSSAQGILEVKDMILKIDDKDIGEDGTIEFRPGERTQATYAVQLHQVGEEARLQILRAGVPKEVTIPLKNRSETNDAIRFTQFDTQPSYYVHAGLVFVPLTVNYLYVWGNDWYSHAPRNLTQYITNPLLLENEPTPVVLSQVLAHDVNVGYHTTYNFLVKTIDGKPIKNIREVIRLIESASENPYLELTDETGAVIVLDRAAAKKAHQEILTRYRIGKDRSADLGVEVSKKPSPLLGP